jgi:sugar phosphate isomerase/epimerase
VLTNPFFALCFDTHDTAQRSLAEQAKLLRQMGFDGAGHLWLDDIAERLATLDAHDLELVQIYLRVSLEPESPPYDPRLEKALDQLRGRRTILGLLISGMPPSTEAGDDRAVAIVREIADKAKSRGIRVALYPHTNDWLEKVSDAIRVAQKVDRPNVGVMFNLCHWMRAENGNDLESVLEAAAGHLMVVTINGADSDGEDWDRLIQPLGSGTYDIAALLRELQRIGFRGPIGLQCFGIRDDARNTLQHSMSAWRTYQQQLATEDSPQG